MPTESGYGQFPSQQTFSTTEDVADFIDKEVKRRRVSKATVIRDLIDAGRPVYARQHLDALLGPIGGGETAGARPV